MPAQYFDDSVAMRLYKIFNRLSDIADETTTLGGGNSFISDFSVISINFLASLSIPPTGTVMAISVKNPACFKPKSSPTISPSLSILLSLGIPWTTSLFMETHKVAG